MLNSLVLILILVVIFLLYQYFKVLYKSVKKVQIKRKYIKNTAKNVTKVIPDHNLNTLKHKLQIDEHKQAPGPLPWPIFGSLTLLAPFDSPFQGFTELAKIYGDAYSLTLGTTRCFIVNNLDLIREVLNKNGKFFGGRPDFTRFHLFFGGNRNNSLALCDWSQLQQKRRNLARKHFSPRITSKLFQAIVDVGSYEVQKLLEHLSILSLGKKETFANKQVIQQTCANMFIQYMCSVRFEYDDIEFQTAVRSFDEIFWEINQGYAVDFLPWLKPFYIHHLRKIKTWSEMIRKFILERIISTRECRTANGDTEMDFTDTLLRSLSEKDGFTKDALIYMLEDFIGGHSAVGNLVMLTLFYIVQNPSVGLQIQSEISNVLQQSNRLINQHDAEKMPYTVATIYEVLRFCSSPIVPHVATEDVSIAGYGVTKDTIVFINNYQLNTSPRYWENPNKFDPTRFLMFPKTTTTTKTSPLLQLKTNIPHFIPFSIGKRTCIGQNLVKIFGFTLLANILHRYDVSCYDVLTLKINPCCIAVPPDTFSLTLTSRSST